MADAMDLGSIVLRTWGFKSPLAHRFLGMCASWSRQHMLTLAGRVVQPSGLLGEIPLTAGRYLPQARLQQRRQHLDREPEPVLGFDHHHPREQGLVSGGLDDVVLGEAPQNRDGGLVYVERVALALIPSEVALPHRRSTRGHDISGGANAIRSRRGPGDLLDRRAPRSKRYIRGQLFPDLLRRRRKPPLIAEDMRSSGEELVVSGFERMPACHS